LDCRQFLLAIGPTHAEVNLRARGRSHAQGHLFPGVLADVNGRTQRLATKLDTIAISNAVGIHASAHLVELTNSLIVRLSFRSVSAGALLVRRATTQATPMSTLRVVTTAIPIVSGNGPTEVGRAEPTGLSLSGFPHRAHLPILKCARVLNAPQVGHVWEIFLRPDATCSVSALPTHRHWTRFVSVNLKVQRAQASIAVERGPQEVRRQRQPLVLSK